MSAITETAKNWDLRQVASYGVAFLLLYLIFRPEISTFVWVVATISLVSLVQNYSYSLANNRETSKTAVTIGWLSIVVCVGIAGLFFNWQSAWVWGAFVVVGGTTAVYFPLQSMIHSSSS